MSSMTPVEYAFWIISRGLGPDIGDYRTAAKTLADEVTRLREKNEQLQSALKNEPNKFPSISQDRYDYL